MAASNFSSIDPDVLTESKILREQEIKKSSVEKTQKILSDVKSLFFSVWRDERWMTTNQVADFYGVSVSSVKSNYTRHEDEFIADGVKLLEDDELRDAKSVLGLSEFSPKQVVFTLRAVLRMGFILRDSPVAAQVRTVALNIIEGVGKIFSSSEILTDLVTGSPHLSNLVQSSGITISLPLKDSYEQMGLTKLKKYYSTGGIPGMTKTDIQNKISALFTRVDTPGWDIKTDKEMSYNLHGKHYRYPDLSFTLPLNVDGKQRKANFMFLFDDLIIEQSHVESAAGKNYLRLSQENLDVDYSFLFFVAPFGATPDADVYIREYWPSTQERGYVGVLTVAELSKMLIKQAVNCKNSNFARGDIKKDFKDISDYPMPLTLMVMLGQGNIFDFLT